MTANEPAGIGTVGSVGLRRPGAPEVEDEDDEEEEAADDDEWYADAGSGAGEGERE